jgi:hypothetical protein
LAAHGNQVWYDGTLIFDVYDTRNPAGTAGFATFGTNDVYFDT